MERERERERPYLLFTVSLKDYLKCNLSLPSLSLSPSLSPPLSLSPLSPPCSVSSNIAQMYLMSILDAHYTTDPSVRLLTTQTILVILRQGLVHPGQCVPYLIALSTDPEVKVRNIVEPQLLEHSTRYGGFMQVSIYIHNVAICTCMILYDYCWVFLTLCTYM